MSYEDERVVKLSFDNEAFKKGVADTLVALKNLEKSLDDIDPKSAGKSFTNLSTSVVETEKELSNLEKGVEKVKLGFTALEVAGITVFANLTTAAIQFSRNLYSNTIGQIASGGFSRALNLENAKFQIEGLGKSWTELKEDILYGVKDTAYGLYEAAKVASQLTSSGMEAGDKMKKTLRGISGVSAMTNSSFSEIGDIFATVAANGKLMTYQLRQFSARGLNVAANMADAFKKAGNTALDTEEKVRDAISKGKISFEEFAFAMDDLFGEHAKEANKTFTGALSNMRAALSRLGEAIQSPQLDLKRRLAIAVIPAIDKLTSAVNKFVVPAFSKALDMLASWVEELTSSYSFMNFIYNVVMGVYSWIQQIVQALWEIGLITPEAKSLAKSLADMTNWMVLNGERGEKFRNVIKALVRGFQTLLTVIDAVVYILEPIYKPVLNFLKSAVSSIGDVSNGAEDIFTKIQNGIKIISYFIRLGLEVMIEKVVKAVRILITVLKVLGFILAAIVIGFVKLIKAIKNFVVNLYNYIKTTIEGLDWLKDVCVKLYDIVVKILENLGKGISAFVGLILTGVGYVWDKISWLFQDHTMKAKVVVDTVYSDIDSSSVDKATQSMSSYSSAATEAAKAGQQASDKTYFKVSGTATGGGYGKIGGGFTEDFWNDIRDKMEDVDDETQNINNSATKLGKGFGDSVAVVDDAMTKSSTFGDSDDNFATRFADRMNTVLGMSNSLTATSPIFGSLATFVLGGAAILASTLEILFDGIIGLLEAAAKSVPVLMEGIVDGIIDSVKRLNTALPQMLRDFASALSSIGFGDIIKAMLMVNTIIVAIFAIAAASRFADPKFFKSIAATILAFGAVIATIGLIAYFVSPKSFQTIMKSIDWFLVILAGLMAIATVWKAFHSIEKTASEIGSGLKAFANALKQLRLIDIKKTNTVYQLGEMLKDLAILVGVMVGFVLGIAIYLDKFGGSFTSLVKSAALIVGTILIIFGLVIVLMLVIGDKAKQMSKTTADFKIFGKKNIQNETTSAAAGIIGILSAITMFVGVVSAGIFALSFRDIKQLAPAFGMIMGAVVVMMASVLGIIVYLNESLLKKGNFWTRDDNAANKMTQLLKYVSLFMITIAKIVITFTAAAKILETVKPDRLKQITILFGVMMAGIFGLMFAYFGVVKLLSTVKFTDGTPSLLKMTIFITGFMLAIGLLVNIISYAIKSLSNADSDTILASSAIIGGVLISIMSMFVAIMAMTSKMSSIKTDKAAAMTVTIGQMAAVLGIMIGAIASIVAVIVILTKVVDGISDPSSIIWSVSIVSGIFLALSVLYMVINKTASMLPSMQSVYGLAILAGALSTMILSIAAFMKIIDTIDLNWKTIGVTIGAIITSVVAMVALSKFISGKMLATLAAGWKGLLVIVGFIAAIAGAIALIGRTIGYVGENIKLLADSFNAIAYVRWDALQNTTAAMKKCIADVIDALLYTLNFKNAVGIIVLSMSLKMLADAVQGLAKLQPEQLTAFAVTVSMILNTFASNWKGALIALAFAALFSAIGWSLAIGMLGFIVFAALVPVMVAAVNNAIKALNGLGELTIDVEKYSKAIMDLMPLAGELFVFGILIGIGAVGLAIGAAALIASVFLLGKLYSMMDSDIGNIEVATAYLGGLIEISILSVIDGWLLSSGAGMLAIGAILMIAAVGIMKGVYKIMNSDIAKIKMAIAYLGGVSLLSVVAIATGIVLIIGAAVLSVGALIFLVAAGSLALALFALQKAFEYVDFRTLETGLNGINDLCYTLQLLGETMQATLPPLVDGMFMLALAMGGFMISGIELLVGATTFGLGLVAIQEAFDIVDPKMLLSKIGDVLLFVGILGLVSGFMAIILLPFTIAAGLFSIGATLISVGIIAFAVSLLIAAVSLNAAVTILQPTFELLVTMFTDFSILDAASISLKLMTLGIGVLISGLLLSLGGVPFLIGTALLFTGSAILLAATDALEGALNIKKIGKIAVGAAALIAAMFVFGLLSPILLVVGGLFIAFAGEIYVGAELLEQAAEKLNNAAELFDEAEESGKNVVTGFINGLADATGLTAVVDTTKNIGETVLNTLSDVLDEHSPSRETFDRGLNAVVGFLNGLGLPGDKVADAVRPIGYQVCDTLDSFGNPLEAIGEAVGISGADGLLGGIESTLFGADGIDGILKSFGDSYGLGLSNILNSGNDALIAQYRVNAQTLKYNADKLGYGHEKEQAEAYAEAAEWNRKADELEAAKAAFSFEVQDFSDWYPTTLGGGGSVGNIDLTAADALASMDTGNSGNSNLAKSAGSNVSKSVTNNNYNFIQNNYSPEPIDRTELYRQTQNQLDAWYKFVRDN